MIPKIIHYCWFGNAPKDYMAKKCIDSFKQMGGEKLKNGMKVTVVLKKTIM